MLAAPRTVNARKSAAAIERAAARRRRARAQGFVAIGIAAHSLDVDRRVLERLHDAGEIPGRRSEGEVQLSRSALAAYCWSSPRCIVDGCGRRVISNGPGCSRHRRHGQSQTDETRRKKSEQLRSGPPVERTCEWCDREFELSAGLARKTPGRFCSVECLDAWLHEGDGAGHRREALRAGLDDWRAKRAAQKAELQQQGYVVGVEAVSRMLPRELHRSPQAVSIHLAAGLLEPALRLEDLRLVAFTQDGIVTYRQRLEAHDDGRLRRFNVTAPDAKPFRAAWYEARHHSQAEFGRLAAVIAAAGGKKAGRPSELDPIAAERIRDMAARGKSQRTIAQTVGVSRGQVRRVLGA